ncbi:MAG: molybdopterin molybdotransferase MoeA, partial [Bacteroidota bacterium]|nr:molybdopterin molybdotransferase MoeA [Bacteroidota bacterium]
MITVEEAEKIIQSRVKDFGIEEISFENCLGRVLAKDIIADRDLPPFNRVTMDGIAINFSSFEKRNRQFKIAGTQAAGDKSIEINEPGECIEIMTGAALPRSADTVIRYEDVVIENGFATITSTQIVKGQSVHLKGSDKKQNEVVAHANKLITPATVGMAASVGLEMLAVKKLPNVVIISSGDELVDVEDSPGPFQIRRSNNYMVRAALEKYGLKADLKHIADDSGKTVKLISQCLEEYDVIILSGGISMGKFDFIPQALETASVKKLFHKVQQRPGKPFWFGEHENNTLVFAFPGNPVSTFMCLHRYLFPWLKASLGLDSTREFAFLNQDFTFT